MAKANRETLQMWAQSIGLATAVTERTKTALIVSMLYKMQPGINGGTVKAPPWATDYKNFQDKELLVVKEVFLEERKKKAGKAVVPTLADVVCCVCCLWTCCVGV